mgnify:CR=1 FL=1
MSLRTAIASCAAAAALIFAAPALAQTEGGLETDLQQNQQQQQQGQGQTPGLQQGQGQGQGQQPQIESTQFEDWTLQCRPQQGQQPRACRMVQAVSQDNSQNQIMQIIIAQPPQRGTVATFVVPLGVYLQQNPAIKVDGNQIGSATYVSCVQQGCVARMEVDRSALTAMRQGRQLQITLTGQRGNSRDISASLLGFTDAYSNLSS